MARKKILLLSVSSGSGHTRAAEALRACASGDYADAVAIHLDTLQYVTPLLRFVYRNLYTLLIKRAPALWRCFYHATDTATPRGRGHKLRRWAERSNSAAFYAEIAECAPDVIICTHFLPAEMLAEMIAKGQLTCPVWVQVTDFDLHRMWVQDRMTGYFAANDEVAFRLSGYGVAKQAIHVTGIAIMPVFSQPPDRAACAHALGLDPLAKTVLLMNGGAAFGTVQAVAEHVLGMQEQCQVIALAGKDGATLAALQQLALRYPGRLVPQGHTDQVERLMACADLVVTKPGGLTSSELLAMGLPMIVIAPIPGQEERNANYLVEQGAALAAFDLATLEYRLRHVFAHPDQLESMGAKAKALGRPGAAGSVLHTVLQVLQ